MRQPLQALVSMYRTTLERAYGDCCWWEWIRCLMYLGLGSKSGVRVTVTVSVGIITEQSVQHEWLIISQQADFPPFLPTGSFILSIMSLLPIHIYTHRHGLLVYLL